MYIEFNKNVTNIVQIKYIKKYTRYSFINDNLFYIKMIKLNTNIKCLSVSGCIIRNELYLIFKKLSYL